MIDNHHHNTVTIAKTNPPISIIKTVPTSNNAQKTSVKNSAPSSALGHMPVMFGKTANYRISEDLIHIILKDPAKKLAKTELIFPRKNLHSFHFSDQETLLEYRKKDTPHLQVSVRPSNKAVTATILTTDNQGQPPAFSFQYKIQKSGAILFSKFIETGWALANSISQSQKMSAQQPISPPVAGRKSTEQAPTQATTTAMIKPLRKPTEPKSLEKPLAKPSPQPSAQIAPPATSTPKKLNKKGTTKLGLFSPSKLLNKQLLPTPLHMLHANASESQIFNAFLQAKKKKILQKITPRIKTGSTLSFLYPDFKKYALIKKVSVYKETPITPSLVQAGYYIWLEDDKIITSSSTKLMPLRVAETILQKHMTLKTATPHKNYLKQLKATYKTAMAGPFALDQKSLRRLRKLLRLARTELKRNHSNSALSPADYGRLLTYLRSWVTYDYLKKFSVSKFQKYYRNVERIQGRGKYAHIKITQILGLQDTGRINENRNFLNHYHYAIERAAQNHPRIPREWIEHIIWIETKGDPRAISHAGAYGLMQLLPDVFMGKGEQWTRRHKLAFSESINPFNAEQNIERGTAFLESLIDYFGIVLQKYPLATKKQIIFHAYNRGPTKVKRLVKEYGLGYVSHLPRETRLYLSRLDDFPL